MKETYIIRVEYKNDDYHAQAYKTLAAAKAAFTRYRKSTTRSGVKVGRISLTIHQPNW